jgi:hypothetical protein
MLWTTGKSIFFGTNKIFLGLVFNHKHLSPYSMLKANYGRHLLEKQLKPTNVPHCPNCRKNSSQLWSTFIGETIEAH